MSLLRLFVYGSLKMGECNFAQVSRFLVSAEPARGPGRMLLRPDGYPALELDGPFLRGSSNREGDLALAGQPAEALPSSIEGELLCLSSGLQVLKQLDKFEGFFPSGESEYVRLLVPVQLQASCQLAWVYVASMVPAEWPEIAAWPPTGLARPAPYQHGRRAWS